MSMLESGKIKFDSITEYTEYLEGKVTVLENRVSSLIDYARYLENKTPALETKQTIPVTEVKTRLAPALDALGVDNGDQNVYEIMDSITSRCKITSRATERLVQCHKKLLTAREEERNHLITLLRNRQEILTQTGSGYCYAGESYIRGFIERCISDIEKRGL
jgi:hypothetical protein